jgi:hypothetical protein
MIGEVAVAADAESEYVGDDELESITHSFVLKIWLIERGLAARSAIWRGYITHVPSGTRRYLQDLDGIALFIAPYLQAMGVEPTRGQRLRRWVQRQKSRLMPRQ